MGTSGTPPAPGNDDLKAEGAAEQASAKAQQALDDAAEKAKGLVEGAAGAAEGAIDAVKDTLSWTGPGQLAIPEVWPREVRVQELVARTVAVSDR